MVIDPITALAFALHTTPGAYAVLAGSGLSSAAGVPTGWAILQDLVGKVARAQGQDVGDDVVGWYRGRVGADPEYGAVLEALAASPLERSGLLRPYIEPTPEERAEGRKVPGQAQRALAQLVLGGYVRVILTTNFDSLIEQALEEAGVRGVVVVASPDAAAGIPPVAQVRCLVVKLHGDYRDARILNAPAELAGYDSRIDRLLDRILDEYGLIVVGWSAQWDSALRTAIERAPGRRYSTYWARHGELTEEAHALIAQRRAIEIPIADGGAFLADLVERLASLREIQPAHPLSAPMAVAALKRYLADSAQRIRVHDLVWAEARSLQAELRSDTFSQSSPQPSEEGLRQRIALADERVRVLSALFAVGCYFGTDGDAQLWSEVLEYLAGPPPLGDRAFTLWRDILRYPALRILFAGGVAAVAAGHYRTLRALLVDVRFRDGGDDEPAAVALAPQALASSPGNWWQTLPGMERRVTPASDWLFTVTRPAVADVLVDDRRYEAAFDRFEYLMGLCRAAFGWEGVLGRAVWRRGQPLLEETLDAEWAAEGERWSPLVIFDDSERLREVKRRYDEQRGRARFRWT